MTITLGRAGDQDGADTANSPDGVWLFFGLCAATFGARFLFRDHDLLHLHRVTVGFRRTGRSGGRRGLLLWRRRTDLGSGNPDRSGNEQDREAHGF